MPDAAHLAYMQYLLKEAARLEREDAESDAHLLRRMEAQRLWDERRRKREEEGEARRQKERENYRRRLPDMQRLMEARRANATVFIADPKERRRYVVRRRLEGATLKQIGMEIGVSVEWARQIYARGLRDEKIRRIRMRWTESRPLDMGGPRDVWLTFYPAPDPRLDNMEPVTA